jgi:hypothetical protein
VRDLAVVLVRAPSSYRYSCLDVKEEALLTRLAGALKAEGVHTIDVKDFHLQRHLALTDVLHERATDYVVAVRETGNNAHYAIRVAKGLNRETRARVWLYGQTDRFRHLPLPRGIQVCPQDELEFLRRLLEHVNRTPSMTDPHACAAAPYALDFPLAHWQRSRFRGAIETSRGCPYPCSFCFINASSDARKKWVTRTPETVLHDVQQYVQRGVSNFVFHDSEFLGGSPDSLRNRLRLVDLLSSDAPDIRYKVYARADTVLKFDSIERLKRSGLASVFIGVESLYQPDLDYFNKKTAVGDLLRAIDLLRTHEVYMDLSFIWFHERTTVESMLHNLEALEALWGQGDKFLGMPYFSFSFESSWRPRDMKRLSGRTYVGWDLAMKHPATSGATFDPELEPLAELYRLLTYEWSKKLIELNLATDTASNPELAAIDEWTIKLPVFCIRTMRTLLDRHCVRGITIDDLPEERGALFELICSFYDKLPTHLSRPATFEAHAREIAYTNPSELLEDDEYWVKAIPLDKSALNLLAQ